MCDATTLGMASLAFTAIGTIQSFMGQRAQAQAAEGAGQFNAAVARNNAIIAERQAKESTRLGKARAAEEQLKGRQLVGLQRATLAGQGVVVDSGSGLRLAGDTLRQAQINAANERANAARQALGFRQQASNFTSQGTLALSTSQNQASAFRSGATSSLLSGAGSVASKWFNFKQAGVFG